MQLGDTSGRCGTSDRHIAPRVPGPNGHLQRGAPAANSFRLCDVLQSSAHALGIAERCPLASSSPTVWLHCRHSYLGRATSSIRPDMIFGKDRGAIFKNYAGKHGHTDQCLFGLRLKQCRPHWSCWWAFGKIAFKQRQQTIYWRSYENDFFSCPNVLKGVEHHHNPEVGGSNPSPATKTPIVSAAYRFSKAALYETGQFHTFRVCRAEQRLTKLSQCLSFPRSCRFIKFRRIHAGRFDILLTGNTSDAALAPRTRQLQ